MDYVGLPALMDDFENSPLLRVFNKKEKLFASSNNVSTSRLSRKKGKNAQIHKPLRILQPFTTAEPNASQITSGCDAVCENDLTVSCSVEDQKTTFTLEANSHNACRDSSDLHNSNKPAHYEYVSTSDLLGSGKIMSYSPETEHSDNGNSLDKKNESIINLVSDDENNSSILDTSNDAANIHTEELVTNHLTLFSWKSAKLIESSPESQTKSPAKESPDVRFAQQSDYDIITDSHTSQGHVSHSATNQTIKITSDKSSDGDIDDVCNYLKNLEVDDSSPNRNSACEILHTPQKSPSEFRVPSTVKKLQTLQSFFSSDEDCSPPPLSKRLGNRTIKKEKQNDTPSAKRTTKNVASEHPKKKATTSSLEYIKKNVLPAAEYIQKDVASSRTTCIKKDATPSPAVYNKNKGIFSWRNTREEDSEVSSSENSDVSYEESASSGSEDFEQFLFELKTPVKKEVRNPINKVVGSTRNFINTGKTEQKKISSTASSPPLPKVKVGSRVLSNLPGGTCVNYLDTKGKEKTLSSSSDDSTNSFVPLESSRTKVTSNEKDSLRKASFLASLSADVPNSLADPAALMYRRQFMKKKEELVEKLFALYNDQVFNNKLPKDMKVAWNPNLRKTAGTCMSKRDPSAPLGRVSRIELAPKVLDSADRVRDTLVHEMCHAACWLIHGIRGGHGSLWKFWASRVQQVFPDIPPVTRCHEYKISTKYVYVCTGCGGRIGRHSKSIDITKSVCSRCKSKFRLVVNGNATSTPSKPAAGFALFVKENYGNLKKKHAGVKHGDIMKMLSTEFAQKTKISV